MPPYPWAAMQPGGDSIQYTSRQFNSAAWLRRCLARHGHKHTWMGFVDVDEFLMFRWAAMLAVLQPVRPFMISSWFLLPGSTNPRARRSEQRKAVWVCPFWRCCRDPWPAVQSLPALLQEFEGPGAPPQANSGKTGGGCSAVGPSRFVWMQAASLVISRPLSSDDKHGLAVCLVLPFPQVWWRIASS